MQIARVLVLAAALATGTAQSAELGFVWVESNVGGASGGHFALRLSDRVYSYHASGDGLLLLERRTRDHFDFHYATLENRPLHVASVEVSDEAFARVRDGFAAVTSCSARSSASRRSCGPHASTRRTVTRRSHAIANGWPNGRRSWLFATRRDSTPAPSSRPIPRSCPRQKQPDSLGAARG